jgi:DNA-directed RNA polymerase subunit beta'
MAVHLPLSVEAQAEARILMLASNNILKPSDGRPVTVPTQDMIIGLHHLTTLKEGVEGEGRAFSSVSEAIMAMDQHTLDINAKVKIRIENLHLGDAPEGFVQGSTAIHETTLGRALFNELLPADYPWVEAVADKGLISCRCRDPRPRQGRRFLLGYSLRCHRRALRCSDAQGQEADHREVREVGRQDSDSV